MTQYGKKRLGRGLTALIGKEVEGRKPLPADREPVRDLQQLPVEALQPSPNNPRSDFPEEQLEELTQSLRGKGVLQPLLVRHLAGHDTRCEIIAGHRRWYAARRAGLSMVPVIIRELSNAEALEVALMENIQRTDLDPLEEAQGYRRLMNEYHYTQQQLSDTLGKSRSHIANTVRLLGLSDKIRGMLKNQVLTTGHARALAAAQNPDALADQVTTLNLSVRQTETLVRNNRKRGDTMLTGDLALKPDMPAYPDASNLESGLSQALGLRVSIRRKSDHGGELRIAYRNREQLLDLCHRLSRRG
ncbi:MAG: ParB/RepB/Spo0J family partition protein [Hyphomicrobiales bacterium]